MDKLNDKGIYFINKRKMAIDKDKNEDVFAYIEAKFGIKVRDGIDDVAGDTEVDIDEYMLNLREYALNISKSREEENIVCAIFDKLSFEEFIKISLQEIAKEANASPSKVLRVLNNLTKLKVLIEERGGDFEKTYVINLWAREKDCGLGNQDFINWFNDLVLDRKGEAYSTSYIKS